MKRFIEWLKDRLTPDHASSEQSLRETGSHLHRTGARPAAPKLKPKKTKPALPKRQPDYVNLDPRLEGRIEDRGPGKNVLIRNKYLREDSGTHETLKILDDSMIDTEEEEGFDPYNTGQFDRSKNWDRRTK